MTTARFLEVLPILVGFTLSMLCLFLPTVLDEEASKRGFGAQHPTLRSYLFRLCTLLFVLVLGLAGSRLLSSSGVTGGQPVLPGATLNVPGGELVVEVADSDQERSDGLSGRSDLPVGKGMLFLFPTSDIRSFWMKEMRFSIDILYLKGGVIQEIFPNVPPPVAGEAPHTVVPALPSDAVLEVFAGETARRGWVKGTQLFIPGQVR